MPSPANRSGRSSLGRVALLGAAAATLSPNASAQDIYKSVGPDGVVTFHNRADGKGERYLKGGSRATVTPVMPSDKSPERFTRYDAHIREAALLYQIPEELVRAVIKVESDFDPRAVSRANARGLMQLIPATAERMLVTDVFEPRQNILGGVRYLRILANNFNGNLELTVAGYNAGEGAVMRHGGIPPYEETQRYVVKVLAYYRYYRSVSLLVGG